MPKSRIRGQSGPEPLLCSKLKTDGSAACTAVGPEHDAAACEWFTLGTEVDEDVSVPNFYPSFEQAMVSQGLCQLSRTASGQHAAYLRLDLTKTDLDSTEPLAHCRHLQQVNISHNQLTTLRSLGQLKDLISLDASYNQLTQVLDFETTSTSSEQQHRDHNRCVHAAHSNLRTANLSCNLIRYIRDLSSFQRLTKLVLDGNEIEYIGNGLQQLSRLQQLSLADNRLSSCKGVEGLVSLRELALGGNKITSLAPVAGLTSLEVLLVAHNQLKTCAGVQGLSSLCRLDVSHNMLRRLEMLAPCQGLEMLGELDVAANPLEGGQNIRLYITSLLTQVCTLNGAAISYIEKVDAANMAGAAAEGLLAIRKHFFPDGELDDGGGAVPPTAAGLIPSRAEEELSCDNADSMFEAIDAWAMSILPHTALSSSAVAAGSGAAAAGLLSAEASSTSPAGQLPDVAAGTAHGRLSQKVTPGSIPRASSANSRLTGVAAIAAKLAAGCSKSAPWSQLQLARACYSWVVQHVKLPCGCSIESGADLVTWDVGQHIFGEKEQEVLWHQALLPMHSGTYAECVAHLLVRLCQAVHLEAVQLSGFWKAGGQHSVPPGDRLAAHNHSWVAVKVNGRWRLLDPVYAILRGGQLPFYLPPEAFIFTHMPFEAYWQLLAEPVSREQWWQMPEVALPFFAVGGKLLDGSLKACNTLQVDREQQTLPSLYIPIAAPATEQQYVSLKLLDHNQQLLAGWQHSMQRQHRLPVGSTCVQIAANTRAGCPLVYQQQVQGPAGVQLVQVGHVQKQVAVQELWLSLLDVGKYHVHVELVTKTPNWLQLSVAGLAQPLNITHWHRENILRVQVIVHPEDVHGPGHNDGSDTRSHIASLPEPQDSFFSNAALQLLKPRPCKLLEADRPELFEVMAPGAAAVAVGCDELGWQALQSVTTTQTGQQQQCGLFGGVVIMPRAEKCFIAVQPAEEGKLAEAGSTETWLPVLSLRIRPQVQHIVVVPDPNQLLEPDPIDPVIPRISKLLAGLDVDGDGVASRKDLLLAFRRDRQLADHLKMQPKVKAYDGTFDKFLEKFISINKDGLGYINLKQLYTYMKSITSSDASTSRIGTAASTRVGSPVGSTRVGSPVGSPTGRSLRGDSARSAASSGGATSRLVSASRM